MRSSWFNKRLQIFLPRLRHNWFLLTILVIVVLFFLLGSSPTKEYDPVTTSPVPDLFTSYRKLKEQAVIDYFDLRALSAGVRKRQKDIPLCGRDLDDHVPCYNSTANQLAGLKNGDEFDRHCTLSRNDECCLVRPPKDYKIPLKWPAGRDVIWSGNVKISKDQFLSSGSMTKRMMLLEENQIAFHSDDGVIFDGVKDYARQVADMIGNDSESGYLQAGVQKVLDIGCGFGSFGAHLVSLKVMPVCIAPYEVTGSQVQLALERGLPAHIGNFASRQLPYPSLSFDMVHCAQCGIDWDAKDGKFIIEVDRVLKPGGYFVLTPAADKSQGSLLTIMNGNILTPVEEFTHKLCWTLREQQDGTFIWQKTKDADCCRAKYQFARMIMMFSLIISPLCHVLVGLTANDGNPLTRGIRSIEFNEDRDYWKSALKNYWSLLSPLIFSDHPKRPGDEDPLPPYNMVRNVMDMNAQYGGFNAALLDGKKSAWVMNVIPAGGRNTLPLILDQGFAGILHDWREPFPTYPRTYDMLHGSGLISHITSEKCSMMDLFLEMDRILRPEGWVVLVDSVGAIEMARMHAALIRWEARVIDLQNGSDQRLLEADRMFMETEHITKSPAPAWWNVDRL
ncbi:hypothetical protein V2J09_003672 [Rumex salicifolius]